MQRSFEESKAHIEQMKDVKIKTLDKRLDAFHLPILERHLPTIDVTSFQKEFARFLFYVDAHLAPVVTVLETAPAVEDDDPVMSTLFGDNSPPPDPSHVVGKRRCSFEHNSHTDGDY